MLILVYKEIKQGMMHNLFIGKYWNSALHVVLMGQFCSI